MSDMTGYRVTGAWLRDYVAAHAVTESRRMDGGGAMSYTDATPAWGRRGWDLGQWPLVVIGVDGATVREYVEGDVTVTRFPSEDVAARYVDGLALYWWQMNGHGPRGAEDYTPDTMPQEWRGAFTWSALSDGEVSS